MELSKVTIDDLYELVKSTLWGWNTKKNGKEIFIDFGDADSDKYIEMEMRVNGGKVEVTFILYSGDETYFNEEKSFDNQVELIDSLKKINYISNLTIDEILANTDYLEFHGTCKSIL